MRSHEVQPRRTTKEDRRAKATNDAESESVAVPSRRSFMKTACLAGLCACGGTPLRDVPGVANATPESLRGMPGKWIEALLPSMATLDSEDAGRILKGCSAAHYEDLAIDATVGRFRGDLPGFLDHLRREWGWIVEYDSHRGAVLVNENKARCVCPLVPDEPGDDLGVLCYCSEGFAERMFSVVTGRQAHAEVTESILRGGARCRYRIEVAPQPA